MTLTQQILTIAIMALTTIATRALPFLFFPSGKQQPALITYLGRVLPLAVFGMLVVYCLKDVLWTSSPYGLPELIGIAVTVAVHVWRRQMMWSMLAGTATYMILILYL